MAKTADAGHSDDLAAVGPLDCSSGGRIVVERHVGPVAVVEADVVPHEPEQVPLTEDDVAIERLVSDLGALKTEGLGSRSGTLVAWE